MVFIANNIGCCRRSGGELYQFADEEISKQCQTLGLFEFDRCVSVVKKCFYYNPGAKK